LLIIASSMHQWHRQTHPSHQKTPLLSLNPPQMGPRSSPSLRQPWCTMAPVRRINASKELSGTCPERRSTTCRWRQSPISHAVSSAPPHLQPSTNVLPPTICPSCQNPLISTPFPSPFVFRRLVSPFVPSGHKIAVATHQLHRRPRRHLAITSVKAGTLKPRLGRRAPISSLRMA
jgi:hypothetical protein